MSTAARNSPQLVFVGAAFTDINKTTRSPFVSMPVFSGERVIGVATSALTGRSSVCILRCPFSVMLAQLYSPQHQRPANLCVR